ncbi:TonB-dependent receptor plug domain-containing protein [Algimonas porphyrae]|uniref:TonB-dependent receptor n=1 Tax=Algimonas porphyrae TaxID=1128113 RepID=A0ABQ5UWA2_9PROT|nr:TonB-dependent receptor [Algimonas porphyrae]GLQ19438.1 hypothetical protein GCM10007854_03930 [Algimonas porphyrae]
MTQLSRKGGLSFAASTLILSGLIHATPAYSQSAEDRGVSDDEIVTIGTRRIARSASNTPAPIDVITGAEFDRNGFDDVQDLLRTAVPSFNVSSQPISDDATIVRPANLRGLSPDQTLVLINGKRRHRGSIITFFGGGVSDGAQGVDISAIPSIALKQVEVLRDGASSQYGSDAIAGVINFVLKDAPHGGLIEAKYGSTYAGDGDEYRLSGNLGLPLGNQGFVNISAEYGEVDPTSRSIPHFDTGQLSAAGYAPATDFTTITGGFSDDVAQYWGRSQIDDDFKLFVNSGLDLSDLTRVYLFGNYAERTVSNGFFYRGPTGFNASGIYEGPSVDPTTGQASSAADAVGSVLVGDLDGLGVGGACPSGIPLTAAGGTLPDPTILAAVRSDANCFSVIETRPGGFTPRFGGTNEDLSITAGIEGLWMFGGGLAYDFSITHGSNQTAFFINNTLNPSLGPDSPRRFRPGTQKQTETILNADFAYLIPSGLASDISLAFGAEYREETFDQFEGDRASYAAGPLAGQGFGVGANGFLGFDRSISASQSASAAYVELETDITEALTLQGALRYEDYSAFGDTLDYKIAGLYRFSDHMTLRATHTTGFHAPTAGQANARRVTTEIENAALLDRARLPFASPAAMLASDFIEARDGQRPQLTTEDANTFTLGAAFRVGPTEWTVDAYQIDVDDRIAQSAGIDFGDVLTFAAGRANVTLTPGATTGQTLDQLAAAGVLNRADFNGFDNVAEIRFFTNSFDTRTRGIDVVGNYAFGFLNGSSALTLAANYNETDVTNVGAVNPIDAGRVSAVEDLLPNWKGFASWTHAQGRWRTLLRANYFGQWDNTVWGVPDQSDELLIDAEIGYRLSDAITLIVGANNLLDNYPDESQGFATDFFGQQYPDFSPSGFDGGQYYTKLRVRF